MKKLICFVVAVLALIPLLAGCYFKAAFDPTVEWDSGYPTKPDDEAAVIIE